MAFITEGKAGAWEIRESRATPRGPRSRTLATFSVLTDDVIERAIARSEAGVTAEELRAAAVRSGAPLPASKADRSAAVLLAALDRGDRPRRALDGVLAEVFAGRPRISSHEAGAAAAWASASPEERARTLVDLLLLGDALPKKRRGELRFPRLDRISA